MSRIHPVEDCSICNQRSVRSLECSHFICKLCVVKSGKPLCPICKADVKLTERQQQECLERGKRLNNKNKKDEEYQAALSLTQLGRRNAQEGLEGLQRRVEDVMEDTKDTVDTIDMIEDQLLESNKRNEQTEGHLSTNGPSFIPPNTVQIDNTTVNFTQKYSRDTLLPQLINLQYAISGNERSVESNIASLKAFGIAASISHLCQDLEMTPAEFSEVLRDFFSTDFI
jgi:hypothetical protein